jgi:hypothetical protein
MRRKMNRFHGYDGDSGSGRLGGSPLAVEKTKITTKLFLVSYQEIDITLLYT